MTTAEVSKSDRWESTDAFGAACKAATEVPELLTISQVNAFQDALRELGYAIQMLPDWRCNFCGGIVKFDGTKPSY